MTDLLSNLIVLVVSIYLCSISIKTYISHSENHEHILFWGVSFLVLSVSSALGIGWHFFNTEGYYIIAAQLVHYLHSAAFILQLYAISYVTNFYNKYNPIQRIRLKDVKKRKTIRTVLLFFTILIIGVIYVLSLTSDLSQVITPPTFAGLTVNGIEEIDIAYEFIHLVIAIGISLLLVKYIKYKIYLSFAFTLSALSHIMQVINFSACTKVINTHLFDIERAIFSAGFIIMLSEVIKLIKLEPDK